MQKMQSKIITAFSVVFLTGLLCSAFYMPKLLNRFYDSRTLGQIHTKKLEFDLYEPAYASFEEKLHAIGMALADGAELELIELMGESDDAEAFIEERVKQEVELFLGKGLQIEVDMDEFQMSSCKLYTVFGSGRNSGNVLSGVQVYELRYSPKELTGDSVEELEKRYFNNLLLYVDTEFYKIYAFSMQETTNSIEFSYQHLEENGTQIILDYWGVGKTYEVLTLTEEYRDRWKVNGEWYGTSEECLTFGDNAQLVLRKEGYTSKVENVVRMGMQPLFDATFATTIFYDASQVVEVKQK